MNFVNSMAFTAITFVAFTALVALISWWKTRGDNLDTQDGYYLGGRSLTGPVIAGSLLMTNLSAEQLVGNNGQAVRVGMSTMGWEVTSAIALVILAFVLMPKYLKTGLTTVPQFFEQRYDEGTRRLVSIIVLLSYVVIMLPNILYAGAQVFVNIFGIDKMFGISRFAAIAIVCVATAIIGSIYAIFGGLKAIALSDSINGLGLIVGGLLVPVFGFMFLSGQLGGDGSFLDGFDKFLHTNPSYLNAINEVNTPEPWLPWPLLFTGLLVKLATASVPAEETQEDPLAKLEPRFLTTPSLALDQAQRCIADMGDTAKQNFHLATDPLFGGAAANEEIFHEHEAFLDRAEVEIGRYLTTIHNIRSVDQRRQMAEMMHSLSDFEKIGDYAQNIFERADEFREAGLSFSPSAMQELRTMCEAVAEVLDMTVDGYDNQAVSTARMVEPLEEVVDTMKERLKSRHIERLGRNECTMQTGIHFLDIVHDLEKISDHCSNIAIYTIQLAEGAAEFDTHAYVKQAYKETPQFAEKLKFYQNKYLTKIDEVEAME